MAYRPLVIITQSLVSGAIVPFKVVLLGGGNAVRRAFWGPRPVELPMCVRLQRPNTRFGPIVTHIAK